MRKRRSVVYSRLGYYAAERSADMASDRLTDVQKEVCMTASKSAADLAAKISIYWSDPDQHSSEWTDDTPSLVDSIIEDVETLLC